MPIYTISAPDGKQYDVKAPEGARKEDLFAFVQQQMNQEAQGGEAAEAAETVARRERIAAYNKSNNEAGFFENLGTGIGSGFTGTLESAALGAATLLDEEKELAARKVIQGLGDRFTPDGGDKDSITYGIGNALGSVAGFLAPAAAVAATAPASVSGAAGVGIGALLGVGTQAGEASERARAAGVSEDVRNDAIRKASPVGLTEVVPFVRVLNRFKKVKKLTEKFGRPEIAGLKSQIQSASITGGAEAAQEVAQTFVQNLVEQGYNPNRLLEEGLIPAAGYGAGAGAIVQGIVDLFGSRRGGRGSAVEVEEDEQIDEMLALPAPDPLDSPAPDPLDSPTLGLPTPNDQFDNTDTVTYFDDQGNEYSDNAASGVSRNDPNRLAALEKTREYRESAIEDALEEDERLDASSDVLNSILGAQESEDRQTNELLKPRVEQQQEDRLQEGVMGLSGTRQTDVDPRGVIDATAPGFTPPILDEYINRAGKKVSIKYTPAAATKMVELGIRKEELVADGGTGKNKAYTVANITALDKSKKANVEASKKPTVSPQMDMIDVAETQELGDIETTAEIEKMVAEDEAVSQQEEMKSVQDSIALELASNAESERLARTTPAPANETRKGNLDLAIQQNSSRNRDDVIDAFEAKGTNYTATEEEKARIDRSIEILDAKPEVAPAPAELQPDLRGQDNSELESFIKEKPAKESVDEGGINATGNGDGVSDTGKSADVGTDADSITTTDTTAESAEKTNNQPVGKSGGIEAIYNLDGSVSVGDITITKVAATEENGSEPTWNVSSPRAKEALQAQLNNRIFLYLDSAITEAQNIIFAREENASGVKSTKGGEPDTLIDEAVDTDVDTEVVTGVDKDVEADLDIVQRKTTARKTSAKPEKSDIDPADVAAEQDAADVADNEKAKADKEELAAADNRVSAAEGVRNEAKQANGDNDGGTDETSTALANALREVSDALEARRKIKRRLEKGNNEKVSEREITNEDAAVEEQEAGRNVLGDRVGNPYRMGSDLKDTATDSDKKIISSLITKTPLAAAGTAQSNEQSAAYYFGRKLKVKGGSVELNTTEAIAGIAYEMYHTDSNKSEKTSALKIQNKFFEKANRNNAKKAAEWITASELSPEVKNTLLKQVNKVQEDIKRVANQATNSAGINPKSTKKQNTQNQLGADGLLIEQTKTYSEYVKNRFKEEAAAGVVSPILRYEAQPETTAKIDAQIEEQKKSKTRTPIYKEGMTPEDILAANEKDKDKAASDLYAETFNKEGGTSSPEADLGDNVGVRKEYSDSVDDLEAVQGFADDTLQHIETDAISALDVTVHPAVIVALKNGDLKAAYQIIAETSQNPVIRRFASAISKNIGKTTVEIVDSLPNKKSSGNFSPKKNKITLLAGAADSTQVLIHEGIHAVISETLNNKSHPLTRQLNSIFKASKGELSSYYGSQDLDEFISEAIGNPSFQRNLASIFAEKTGSRESWENSFEKLRRVIANFFRRLVGKERQDGPPQTFEEFTDIIEAMLSPAPDSRSGADLNMIAENNQEGAIIKQMVDKFLSGGRAAHEAGFKRTAGQIFEVFPTLNKLTKTTFLGFMNSHMLGQISENFKIKSAMAIHNFFNQQEAAISEGQAKLDRIISPIDKWVLANQDNGKAKLFNWMVHDSTRKGVDPSKPKYFTNKDGEQELTYKGDKLKIWSEYQKDWTALGKEGQTHYKNLRDSYKTLYNQMLSNLNFKVDSLIGDKKIAADLKTSVFSKLFKNGVIDPYFPLTRSGEHWLEYNAVINGRLEYVVEAFDTVTGRKAAIVELKNNSNVDSDSIVEFPKSSLSRKTFDKAPPISFVADMLKTLDKNLQGVEGDTKETIKKEITELFLNTLPESSFMRSMQARSDEDSGGKEGFQESATEAFRLKSYDLSRQNISIEYGEKLRNQLDLTIKEIDILARSDVQGPKEISDVDAEVLKEEWSRRVQFATNPPNTLMAKAARTANRMAFLGTIGFNMSSALVNLTQIPLIVFPYMAGKTSFKQAMRNLKIANHLVLSSGMSSKMETVNGEISDINGVPSIDNRYLTDKNGKLSLRDDLDNVSAEDKKLLREILPLVQAAKDNAFLNRSLINDTLTNETSGKSKNWWDKVSVGSAFFFHTAERYNRQTALIASFLNEKERLTENKDKALSARNEKNLTEAEIIERAVENAMTDTQMTNGGAVLPTAPRFAQEGIGRVALMYKSFGIQMYYTQARMWQQYFKNWKANTAEEVELKREAKNQLVGLHLSGLFLSGVSGFTIYGIVAGFFNSFVLDDDDEDADTIVRKYLGEEFFKGGVNQLTTLLGGQGVDVATRIGLSNLLVAHNRYSFDPSPEKSIVKTLGGPAYGFGSQVVRGWNEIGESNNARETWRGVENLLPAAFRNMMRSARYGDEGALTRRGDPIMGEIDGGLLASQFFGFAPAEYTMNQERNQAYKKIDTSAGKLRTSLHKEYYIALRFGDSASIPDIMDRINKFNSKHPQHRITGESIRDSIKGHRESTARMYKGVTFSPANERKLKGLADEWNQGLNF